MHQGSRGEVRGDRADRVRIGAGKLHESAGRRVGGERVGGGVRRRALRRLVTRAPRVGSATAPPHRGISLGPRGNAGRILCDAHRSSGRRRGDSTRAASAHIRRTARGFCPERASAPDNRSGAADRRASPRPRSRTRSDRDHRSRPGRSRVLGARLWSSRRGAGALGNGARTTPDNVTAFLRPAAEADLNQIVQIERESFADPWTEESFRRLLGGHPAIFQVITYPPDTRIAGYVIAFSVGEEAELLNVAVEPKFRGRGLAGQMLDAVLIELGGLGVRTAFLEVRESNTAALALYGSRGFTEI